MSRYRPAAAIALLTTVIGLAGCGSNEAPAPAATHNNTKQTDDVAAERAKLDPADRALVDAQEWCAVSTDERLGSMGPPLKLDIKGQPVFICCKGCKRKAEADPDKTLAKVEELKAKAKAMKAGK